MKAEVTQSKIVKQKSGKSQVELKSASLGFKLTVLSSKHKNEDTYWKAVVDWWQRV